MALRAEAVGLFEVANEIRSKQDWQVAEGTVLGRIYEKRIKTAECNNTLNESRYSINSIKDAFNKLM